MVLGVITGTTLVDFPNICDDFSKDDAIKNDFLRKQTDAAAAAAACSCLRVETQQRPNMLYLKDKFCCDNLALWAGRC